MDSETQALGKVGICVLQQSLCAKIQNNREYSNGFLFVPRMLGTIVSIDGNNLIGVVTMETIDRARIQLEAEMGQHGKGWTKTKAETLGLCYDSVSVDMVMRDKPCPAIYKVRVK